MMHRTTPGFWERYGQLPREVREVADRNFGFLKSNPRHPSLHFKKVGRLWAVRVGIDYRALAVEDGEDFLWVWIGPHDEYLAMIKGR